MKKSDPPQKSNSLASKDWNEKKASLFSSDFECAAQTHIGHARPSNQDRFVIQRMTDGAVLMALADGLGGDPAGDLAAATIRDNLLEIKNIPISEEEKTLTNLARRLDLKIQNFGQTKPGCSGMGSTLIIGLIRASVVWWLHIGDSRMYLFHDSRLNQITEDQTLDRFLIKENILDPEDAPFHYSRHVMDQFVGCGFCKAASGSFPICSGDSLVLTSDGVYRYIAEASLAAVLAKPMDAPQKCLAVVETVLKNSGKDNLTIMIYHQK